MTTYVTAAIPYVNARPHIGHALEIVQTDVVARHSVHRREDVRFVCGSDDNALKNVQAAKQARKPVRQFVDENAAHFETLNDALGVDATDFFKTSTDSRHIPGVERLWRESLSNGDLYEREYEGLYCIGCEQFLDEIALQDGLCPDHGVRPDLVSETNWFFRLSRYQDQLLELIKSDTLRIEPLTKKNEVLAFIGSGLEDFSVSRPALRAEGWGIPVPDDPTQVIYVWWDALGYYLTSLGYGLDDTSLYDKWWQNSDERVQIVGKGIVRFHAVYWPAILLSVGAALPTKLCVHEYLTANGQKISKTSGNGVDPINLVDQFGVSAVRWWLLRDVARVGDTDFSETRLVERWNIDIVGGIGNLVNRTVTLVQKKRDRRAPHAGEAGRAAQLQKQTSELSEVIDTALDRFDFKSSLVAVESLVGASNRLIETTQPWKLNDNDLLDAILSRLIEACRAIATALEPFVPDVAAALHNQLTPGADGKLPEAKPSFRRLNHPRPLSPQADYVWLRGQRS